MTLIRMTHPNIEATTDDPYEADPLQVPHLEAAGWQVADGEDDSAVERWPAELRRYEGRPTVQMRHPQIEGDPITVTEGAAPYHRERGWLVIGSEDEVAARGEQYDSRTVEELKAEAKARGLKVSGTKDELVERLRDAEQPEQDTTQNEAGEQPAQDPEEA